MLPGRPATAVVDGSALARGSHEVDAAVGGALARGDGAGDGGAPAEGRFGVELDGVGRARAHAKGVVELRYRRDPAAVLRIDAPDAAADFDHVATRQELERIAPALVVGAVDAGHRA